MVRFRNALGAVALLCLLPCCAPSYDAQADALQLGAEKKLDAGLIRLAADQRVTGGAAAGTAQDDAAYASNVPFYADIESDLTTLRARLAASGDASGNSAAAAVDAIARNVTLLETTHARQGTLSPAFLDDMRRTIDGQFAPLNAYQVQRQAGHGA